jgi:hypothetical protein
MRPGRLAVPVGLAAAVLCRRSFGAGPRPLLRHAHGDAAASAALARCDVAARDEAKRTPLHDAAAGGSAAVVRILTAGARSTLRGLRLTPSWTPRRRAARRGRGPLAGANPTHATALRARVLDVAQQAGRETVAPFAAGARGGARGRPRRRPS